MELLADAGSGFITEQNFSANRGQPVDVKPGVVIAACTGNSHLLFKRKRRLGQDTLGRGQCRSSIRAGGSRNA